MIKYLAVPSSKDKDNNLKNYFYVFYIYDQLP